MKITYKDSRPYGASRGMTAVQAVEHILARAAGNHEGRMEREAAKVERLAVLVGSLIDALAKNGAMRAEQLNEIFDYDVTAEA